MKSLKAVLVSAVVCASGAAFAAGGTISGTVSFTGTPPQMEPLKRSSDPICAKKQFNDESVIVTGGKLQNVVLRLKGAPAGQAPAEPVVIDQTDCMYRPRVQAAVQGQKVMVKNSDGTLHNVHTYSGSKTLFNQAQPPKAAPITKEVKDADVMKLKCDVHPWMTGYVVYSGNPYFAVSKEDGKFEIKNVPAGKYTLEAWHEKLGTQTAEVTVQDGKTAQANLAFAAK
jgi:plastocyanin